MFANILVLVVCFVVVTTDTVLKNGQISFYLYVSNFGNMGYHCSSAVFPDPQKYTIHMNLLLSHVQQ